MKKKTVAVTPYYLFVFAIFLLLIAPTFLTEGIFMDGLYYGTIARNLAAGEGSFWYPLLTQTFHNPFHEHPPLVFGIEASFFHIFGDHYWVDKLYSVITFIVTGAVWVAICKTIFPNKSHHAAWFVLLLWIITPLVAWAATNNMLENTMMIFTSLAILFILKGQESYRSIFLSLAGLSLLLGFLCKGFVALFPFSLPLWLFLFNTAYKWKQLIADTTLILAGFTLSSLLLFLLFPEAKNSLEIYLNQQVIASVSHMQTVDTRFFILIRLLQEIIPAAIITTILAVIAWRNKTISPLQKPFFIFLCLGLAGVAPIMISLKQSGFYILAALPCFSLAIGSLIAHPLSLFMEKINTEKYRKKLWIASLFTCACAILFVWYFSGAVSRDNQKIIDMKTLSKHIPQFTTIAVAPSLMTDWELYAYLYRYGRISLKNKEIEDCKYLLAPKNTFESKGLTLEAVPLQIYNLYRIEKPIKKQTP